MNVIPTILTWFKVTESGSCFNCRKPRALFHALEQNDPAQGPLCQECVLEVEHTIGERRARAGVMCYRCNRTDGLRTTGLLSQPGKFFLACPACYPSAERTHKILLDIYSKEYTEQDLKAFDMPEVKEYLLSENIDAGVVLAELRKRRQLQQKGAGQ